MKANILILSNEQFGYLVDYYYYSKYLNSNFNITFVCPDDGHPKITESNVNIEYLPPCRGFKRRIAFFKKLKSFIIEQKKFDVVLIGIKGGFIFHSILSKISQIVINDIRTLDISDSSIKRKIANQIIKFESSIAYHTTVISKLVADKLKLSPDKYSIVPLGGNIINCDSKDFNKFNLIYVGTFLGRNIEETIKGLAIFINKHPEMRDKIHYDIIGSGIGEDKISQEILINKITDIVTMHGYIPNNHLNEYFSKANIGVSYIPINEKYDIQHPTKTYEYLCAGMPVIATSTSANKEIINSNNGITIYDKPEDFCKGIEDIIENSKFYDSEKIKDTMKDYTWEHIANKLCMIIEKMIKE